MKSGTKTVWAAIAAGLGWAAWRTIRYQEDPTRRIAGVLGAGAILLFTAGSINEQFAGAMAWLILIGGTTANAGILPSGTTEGQI